jgi:predicted Rossmann-fold nucleotide-binding protein
MAKIFIEGNHNCLPGSKEYKTAEELGYELTSRGYAVVSSARKGISEAVFCGAIRGDDNSKRIAIDCAEIDLPRNTKFNKEVIADNFFDMKMRNCTNSDAFIFLPGSFNVLANMGIVLQLKQFELMGNKPMICMGEQLSEALQVFGFYNEDVLDGFKNVIMVSTPIEAVQKLNDFFKKPH